MQFNIPKPLKEEHEVIHEQMQRAISEQGAVGIAAQNIAKILHPHFVKEEEFATPPLGLLTDLAKGLITDEMKPVWDMTERLKLELPQILKEHDMIKAAIQKLISASKVENKPEYEELGKKMILHAQTEEEVLYPAAILIGEYLKEKFKSPAEI